MPKHVLFLSAPAFGHVFPTLTIAEALARRGHRVSYATTEFFAQYAEQSGVTPLIYGPTLAAIPAGLSDHADTAEIVLTCMRFYEEGLRSVASVEALVDTTPDLIVFDPMMYGAAAVLGRKWTVPIVLTHPNLAFNDTVDWTAPRRAELLAGPRGAEAAAVESGLQDLFLQHGIDETLLHQPNDLALVFVPKAFQPQGDSFSDHYAFVGPCNDGTIFQGDWQPPTPDSKVLFISLGTVHNARPDFFRLFATAFADLDWHVVVTLGGWTAEDLGDLPPNFEVHPWLPQLAVLEHATVFLSNGGLGGVMAAVQQGTPLLLAPEVAEQDMDARQVVELGLGRIVELSTITPESLRQAVLDLSTDTPTTARLNWMRDRVTESGGTTRAADLIEKRMTT
ncbi:macrolide family glycosyltransferase [Umezawaea tangerina]|uniref:dTDP-L-oleandrosyltransferase n=1 Tax=Umezawaea tangerina TaxID=84725 RepID=A0A2T0T3Z0_9PSEU|nr:macrolide family glycosyltransferase [Umezawaea tangerina]PRY40386.1 dTDP-L-oleandrosyltransferase [Umezawaea tangerina]